MKKFRQEIRFTYKFNFYRWEQNAKAITLTRGTGWVGKQDLVAPSADVKVTEDE